MSILKSLLELIFPSQCLFCQCFTDFNLVCLDCERKVREEFFVFPLCLNCGKPAQYETKRCLFCRQQNLNFKIRSLAPYEGMIKDLIVHYKIGLKKDLASFFTRVSLVHFYHYLRDADGITFIPATRRSLKRRGFNPAELLAKKIAERVNLPLVDSLLYLWEPKEQKSLDFQERKNNLRGAFGLKPELKGKLSGFCFILVDDVLTTGATLKEAVKVLKKEGKVREVNAFTFARQL